MLRTTIYVAATLALAATIVFAAEFSDKDNTFRISAPNGWTAEKDPTEEVAVSIDSPRIEDTGGNCGVLATAENSSKMLSQDDVDQILAKEINEKFWQDIIAPGDGVVSSKLEQSGEKSRKGRRVFYAKATTNAVVDNISISLTQLMELQAVPGRIFVVSCSALTEGFAQESADFEAILSSFEPRPFLTVSAGRPQGFAPRGIAPAAAHASAFALRIGAAHAKARHRRR